MNEFHTYIYYDPSRNNEPFYVGKGKDDRWRIHLRKSHSVLVNRRINVIREEGFEPLVGVYSDIDQEFAFFLEQELISHFGRNDLNTGSLLNLTDGGDGCYGFSEATRAQMSESHKKTWTPAKRKRASEIKKGFKHTEETKAQIAKTNTGRHHTEETKAQMSISMTGIKKGPMPEEQKNQISETLTGRETTDEHRSNLSKALKGKPLTADHIARSLAGKAKAKEKRLANQLKQLERIVEWGI